ncbi:MAG: DUF4124 domain-containing protein [Steroidobacteraceae bacterium]
MRITLLLALTLAIPAFASQVVYKWVDPQGVTHYSDRPVPGAERVELRAGTTTVTPGTPPATTSSTNSRSAASGPAYRNVEIWKPSNDEVFFNVGGKVDVNVRVDPALLPGHTLSLYLDGRLVEGFAPGAEQFSLNEVYRGTHSVVAVITDQSGKRIAETPQVTFHVRQTSAVNSQNSRPRGR